MRRARSRILAALATGTLAVAGWAVAASPAHALTSWPTPKLQLATIFSSHPWAGSSTNAGDLEGSAYTGGGSLWVTDDNNDAVYELNALNGTLRNSLHGGSAGVGSTPVASDFWSIGQEGSPSTLADYSRTDDFEALAYDGTNDVLYLFSGACCNPTAKNPTPTQPPYHPTAWKLTRQGGTFKPVSWQPLPETEDPTAAGWSAATGLYLGHGSQVRPYDYATNTVGAAQTITIPGATAFTSIVGMTFVGSDMILSISAVRDAVPANSTNNPVELIMRVNTTTWTAVPNWTFNLSGTGVVDPRSVEIIGDTFYVLDGYDYRAGGDHPIYVFNLANGAPPLGWHYGVLNAASQFGGGNALLRYGTQLHGFYGDTANSSLSHSWWDGYKWNVENLDGHGKNTGNAVGANVTALQYGSQLQLFYTDATAHDLRHAWWDGRAWHFESLDGAGGANGRTTNMVAAGDIAVRQYGSQLQLFYSDDSAHALRHAWWDGRAWHFENLDAGGSLPSSATYVSATQYGSSFQVMYAGNGGTLRHAWYDGAWHKETLDGGGGHAGHTNANVGDYVQVLQYGSQLDAVYQDTDNAALRHAWWNGATWSFETLDGSGGAIPGATSHDVGADVAPIIYGGGLHLWYRDTTSGALRHAWYAGGWHVEILDGSAISPVPSNSTDTGRFAAVTQYGNQLQLTYFDHARGDRLVHAWYP